MLISRRKEGETLFVGDDVEIRIVEVRKKKVILGIIAPAELKIVAQKLNDMVLANTMAAVNCGEIEQFLHPPAAAHESVVLLLDAAGSKECENQPIREEEA